MPINVDTVYQTVQALANKEQRGYLTPQEFNLFAIQAQNDIFEQYFYDLNAFRLQRGEQNEIGDSVQMIMEKLRNIPEVSITFEPITDCENLPNGYTGKIFFTDNINGNLVRRTVQESTAEEIYDLIASRWHKEGFDHPLYFEDGNRRIQVWNGEGKKISGCTCETVVGRPGLVYWGYQIVNEKPVYNPNTSKNFSLDASEQADIVISILKLAGVSIEDPQLYSAASAEEQTNINQENK